MLQLLGGLRMYGRLGPAAPAWVGTARRVAGAKTALLVVFVSYHCLWTLGVVTGTWADGRPVTTRTVVHALIGCAVIGALVVKVVAVRSRRAPGWFLPTADGLLFALISSAR